MVTPSSSVIGPGLRLSYRWPVTVDRLSLVLAAMAAVDGDAPTAV